MRPIQLKGITAHFEKESDMSVRARFVSGVNFFRVDTRVGIFALSGVLLGVCASAALAATPAAFFNNASVIGLNKMIATTHVPIQTGTGTIIYKDVTIQINVDAAGNLTYATATPIATLSPTLSATNIRAGIYTDSLNAAFGIQVSGPAIIPGGGGEGQWSITAAAGLSCDASAPSTFYTGPSLALANSKLAARVKTAGITATQYSFGELGENGCQNDGNWYNGALIGVTAVGNQLQVSSFTHLTGADSSSPVETVTYNFKQ
jgi:hypothetical protein